jgi:hypothetical protein
VHSASLSLSRPPYREACFAAVTAWRNTRASAAADRPRAALSRGERGALEGALALGTTAAVIRASMCERGESCTGPTIGWGLMGTTIGVVLGSLIAARDE